MVSLSNFKIIIISLEPTDKDIIAKLVETHGEQGAVTSEYRKTDFTSGDMVTIIFIQSKIRNWKFRALHKG